MVAAQLEFRAALVITPVTCILRDSTGAHYWFDADAGTRGIAESAEHCPNCRRLNRQGTLIAQSPAKWPSAAQAASEAPRSRLASFPPSDAPQPAQPPKIAKPETCGNVLQQGALFEFKPEQAYE